MTTVLEDASSPTQFAYDFVLPEGATIEEAGGALYFLDREGSVIGGVAPAWSVDASGEAVATHYAVNGTTVTQFVEVSLATAFPVVADALWGTDLIDKASWILRGSVVSLSLVPSGWMRLNAAFGPAITEGWKEALAKTPTKTINGKIYNRTKANTTQMYWQFQCHQVIAFVKPEWNLEPSNYRPSYAAYSANGCN